MNYSELTKTYPGYRLKAFQQIIAELLAIYPTFPELPGLKLLELGPGQNLELLRLLRDQGKAAVVQGIGRSRAAFWKRPQPRNAGLVEDTLILPALQQRAAASVDLIYSRHVLEQHSIEAAILLQDPEFKRTIKDNRFGDLPEAFPAAPRNILAIFGECYRILKPGGVIISQIAKQKYRVLLPEGLQAFKPAKLSFRQLGRFSELSVFIK